MDGISRGRGRDRGRDRDKEKERRGESKFELIVLGIHREAVNGAGVVVVKGIRGVAGEITDKVKVKSNGCRRYY
jgi:hypothetical protein